MKIELQPSSEVTWVEKYQLKDHHGNPIEASIEDSFKRVSKALASLEENSNKWEKEFYEALIRGVTPAGRIMSNAGAEDYKPATSLINCTVSGTIEDTIESILESNRQAGLTLAAGCGIGYEFSTLRPKGAYVQGAGAITSGPLSFMDIFDAMCDTISSAGGRRGAQMGTFAVWHPDVEAFIKAKRENGRLRKFNLSLLITDDFMEAVKNQSTFQLVFPVRRKEIELGVVEKKDLVWKKRDWEVGYCERQDYILNSEKTEWLCKVYKEINAIDLWDLIMKSTYDFAEPGFLLIDRINQYNNNYFCEEIRATNPCGEQPLPPNGSCLLGSLNLAKYVVNPFTPKAYFDWKQFRKDVRVFTRILDNVVELNGLPLEAQRHEILYKRRHGMGFMGLGSTLSLLGKKYDSDWAINFTEEVSKAIAVEGFEEGIDLAIEKGPAPIFEDSTNGVSNKILWCKSEYMKKIWSERPDLKEKALKYGCRFTHHSSVAPTGTIAYSINNNVSNGIEPTFTHEYTRNIIKPGRKTKEAVKVKSYELWLYEKLTGKTEAPEKWSTTENISPKAHVDIQAAAQKWVDSSISKTINVPTQMPFEEFKDIYLYAYEKGLKGCTTFRFNPETLQGVLVKDTDLDSTEYIFTLENGEEIVAKGADQIEYDGEVHSAQNLYDAIKEGYFGRLN